MKRVTLLLAALALVGIANANMLINGDFEDSTGAGWSQWWGGNSNRYVSDPTDAANHCAGTWWSDDGVFQGIAIGAGQFTVSGSLMQENLANRIGVIVAEAGVWNPNKWAPGVGGIDVWWTQQIVIAATDPANTWITGSTVIDNTAAGATFLNINLFMINQGDPPTGIVRFDNVSVVPEPATMGLLGLGAVLRRRK